MIVSAISSHMQGARGDLSDVVKYYPLIKFSDEGGSVKTEVMNRYFLMLEQKELKNKSIEEIKYILLFRKKLMFIQLIVVKKGSGGNGSMKF